MILRNPGLMWHHWKMNIPSSADIRRRILPMTQAQLRALQALSGVPFDTLMKIRLGAVQNPGIETVRKFVGHIREAKRQA